MIKYYIKNQRDFAINVTDDAKLKEFLIDEDTINEHLKAQIAYFKSGHKKHQIQPIVIGVSGLKFIDIVEYLSYKLKGFLRLTLLRQGYVSISLKPNGTEIIKIVNRDLLED
jgi:hypothetical protein